MSDGGTLWYREGLRFRCTRCGNCCRGDGNVWVSDAEIGALATRLGLSDSDLRSGYTRRSGRGIVLAQKRNQDCIFFDGSSGCEVYADRPRQCRTYPFWRGIVHSRDDWDDESRCCPGIGRGDLHPPSEIAQTAATDGIPEHRTRTRVDHS